jgi:hypothetical protein
VRSEYQGEQLARRLLMLGIDERRLHDPAVRRHIGRALRREQRAARSGRPPYDPLRHLVLVRLERKLKKSGLRRATRTSTCET